ncbi:MAG: ATP-dependent helicase [Deltaproteobacteria bacterium]|nr:ATP-dependent helicase [Deltaproteobacteria bacterium]
MDDARTSKASGGIQYSPEQRAIIDHRDGPLQVVACAGSGKTETVAVRVASLLEEGVAPPSIIAFTFTRAASAGLKTRILTRYQERNPGANLDALSPLYVGTFHAYCLRLLQVHVPRYATFSLFDDHRLIGLVLREYFDLGLQHLGIKNITECAREFVRNAAVIENEMIPVEKIDDGTFKNAYVKLLDMLDRYHVLTHNQCITRAVEALSDKSTFARVHAPLRHLIVDEFQDINPAQARLIERLATAPTVLCVVGDDDQAIYQWRGSSVAYLQAFQQKFGATQHTLGLNRRSTVTIVDAASEFAWTILPRIAKPITGSRPAQADSLRCYGAPTAAAEAERVADAIESLHAASVAYCDMAVLLRAVKTSGGAFLDVFEARKIPYRCEGRSDLFLQPDARFFAYLYAWLAQKDDFYNARARKMEPLTLGSLLQEIDALYAPDATHRQMLVDGLPAQRKAGPQSPDADLVGSFYRIASLLQIDRWDLSDPEKAARLGSLARFTKVLADFETVTRRARRIKDPALGETVRGGLHGGEKYLKKFADYLSFYAQSDYEDFSGEPDFDLDAVTVTTVHAAKGLEWPVVFVPCLTAARFPSSRTGKPQDWMIPRSLFPVARYEGSDADERRLFYVAMTRARDLLVLSTHEQVTSKSVKPSPYFSEVADKTAIAWPTSLPLPSVLPHHGAPSEDKPTFSFSELAQFGLCPLQYRLRSRLNFEPRAVKELGYGNAVHHVLRRIAEHTQATGQVPGAAEIRALFHREFYLPLADKPAWDSMQARAEILVANYITDHGADLQRIWEVERPFELHLEHANVVGRADVILDREGGVDGALAIVDYKTRRVDADPEMGLQLQVYTAAGRGEGFDVKAAWLHDLTARGMTARLPVVTDDAAVGTARTTVDVWAKGIREKKFDPCPGDHCKHCDVREICRHRKG